jgi:dTDP-4-amino-4,6-dideoxygalactose transaminase
VSLPHLDGWVTARREAAAAYARNGLGDLVALPQPTPGADPAWHLYVIRDRDPDGLAAALAGAGVEARAYYRVPVHAQPAMRARAERAPDLPGTTEAARTHLALPMSAGLTAEQVGEVVKAVRAARG